MTVRIGAAEGRGGARACGIEVAGRRVGAAGRCPAPGLSDDQEKEDA
jgi:hypothetical protein